jgi:hypothetical protein
MEWMHMVPDVPWRASVNMLMILLGHLSDCQILNTKYGVSYVIIL